MSILNAQSQTSQSLETSMITSTSSSWYAIGSNVACHNPATARAQIAGTREHAIVNKVRSVAKSSPALPCMGFVSPTGAFYAVVSIESHNHYTDSKSLWDLRIDCANESTLRSLMNNGVHTDTIRNALRDQSNLRPAGGWSA